MFYNFNTNVHKKGFKIKSIFLKIQINGNDFKIELSESDIEKKYENLYFRLRTDLRKIKINDFYKCK